MGTKTKITLISIFSLTFFSYIVYTIIDENFTKEAVRGKANIKNANNVKLFMKKKEFLNVMGQSDSNIDNMLIYETNDESYPTLIFEFDSAEILVEINSLDYIKSRN